MTRHEPERFVRENTAPGVAPLVPEIPLYLATEIVPIWRATEDVLEREGVPPPYWAFAWAGGQALSRWILDHPEAVAGRRVLDFAAGSGIQAIAAMRAGAASVLAADIDPFSIAAVRQNATLNGVQVETTTDDLIGRMDLGVDVVLAGDICYERPVAERVISWFRAMSDAGVPVFIGDPGRNYLPRSGLEQLEVYSVITTKELEDHDVRRTVVWRLLRTDELG